MKKEIAEKARELLFQREELINFKQKVEISHKIPYFLFGYIDENNKYDIKCFSEKNTEKIFPLIKNTTLEYLNKEIQKIDKELDELKC